MNLAKAEIKAVGYDVDGTLINSEPHHVRAWQEALKRCGRRFEDLSPTFRETMAGRKPIAIARFMIESLGISIEPETFLRQKHEIFWDSAVELEPMPGATESVHRLGKHYLLGINTSLSREHLGRILGILGLEGGEFHGIVTGDRLVDGRPLMGKPNGESYQLLAAEIGVEPNEMVAIEDAATGVAAAEAAGAYCIGVENKFAAPQNLSGATAVVGSLDLVTPELIQSLVP
jgi:beta-phosphoglucomutase-like phosphatase (HAD superfamily)